MIDWSSRFRVTSLLLLLAVTAALMGCTVKTTVQATTTTPANVTHMYVTVQEVWLNTDAGAAETDDGWVKKVFSEPTTIDLAALNNGVLASLTRISLASGDYSQLRIVLADSAAALTSGAQTLGLTTNAAVQYVDASGVSHLVPLELASPNSALLMPLSIKLNGFSSAAVFSGAASSDLTSTSTTDATTSGTGVTGAATAQTATISVDIDALRKLTLFSYGGQIGALLNPGLNAYDTATVGTITGQFDLTAIATAALTSDQGIVVSAETLNDDGHYVVTKSTRINSDGSFTLYPLPANSDGSITYDLVVHGPGVETLIVTAVPVTTNTTTTLQTSAITLPSAASFTVNTSNTSVPGGTQVDFEQTLPANGTPYVIETAAVNPFSGNFPEDISLSNGPLIYGAYNAGDIVTFVSADAQQGNATYQVVTEAPLRSVSTTPTTVTAASIGLGNIALPQPGLSSSAVPHSISGHITLATPGKYDSLYLLISHGGQLVDAISLSASLANNSDISFSAANVPGGVATATYDVALRAWSSADPVNTLTRIAFAKLADLRQVDASGLTAQLP